MTNKTKVIIAFSAAALVGCVVIGCGLYMRAAEADLREARRKRARIMATRSLQEFAWESVTRQDKLLAEARDAAGAMASSGVSEDAEAVKALRRWELGCTDFQARSRRITAALAALAKSMAQVFPQDPDEQLAPEVVTGLTGAVAKARGADRWATTVKVGTDRVDITAVVADDLHKLAVRANDVEAELARREIAYAAFVERARWAVRDRDAPAGAGQLSGKWLARVARDPAKKKTVTELATALAACPSGDKDRKKVADQLDAIAGDLAAVTSPVVLVRVSARCGAAVRAGRAYPSLRPRIEKAQRVLAAAEERTAHKVSLTPSQQQKRWKWQRTLEVGRKVIELSKITTSGSVAQLARKTKWQQIQALVIELAKADRIYAEAMEKLLAGWYAQVGRPSTPRTPPGPQRFLTPPWNVLKMYDRELVYSMTAMGKVRGIVEAAPVRWVGTGKDARPHSKDVKSKKAVMNQLATWASLLAKQKDDVAAMAKKNER